MELSEMLMQRQFSWFSVEVAVGKRRMETQHSYIYKSDGKYIEHLC